MVWLKLSDDFPDDCAREGLTDAEFRTHVEALAWCMRRENGGRLDAVDVKRAFEVADPHAAIRRLVEIGWWEVTATGWRVRRHMDQQVDPETLAHRRELATERQRRARRKKAGVEAEEPSSRRDIPSAATGDGTRDPGLDWAGLDGEKQALKEQLHMQAPCVECQRMQGFGSGPCPVHRLAA